MISQVVTDIDIEPNPDTVTTTFRAPESNSEEPSSSDNSSLALSEPIDVPLVGETPERIIPTKILITS